MKLSSYPRYDPYPKWDRTLDLGFRLTRFPKLNMFLELYRIHRLQAKNESNFDFYRQLRVPFKNWAPKSRQVKIEEVMKAWG